MTFLSYIKDFSLVPGEEETVEEADGPVEEEPDQVPGLQSRLLQIILNIYSV